MGHMFGHICISLLVAPVLPKRTTAPSGSTVSGAESWQRPRQIKRHASHSRRVGVEKGWGVEGHSLPACLRACPPLAFTKVTPGKAGTTSVAWSHPGFLSGPPALAVATGEGPNRGPDVPLLPGEGADGGSAAHNLNIYLHSSRFAYVELSGAEERCRT